MSRSRKQVGDVGPKDGCPTGAVVIRCASGPTYNLLVTGDTPADLRAKVLRAAEECKEIEAVKQFEAEQQAKGRDRGAKA